MTPLLDQGWCEFGSQFGFWLMSSPPGTVRAESDLSYYADDRCCSQSSSSPGWYWHRRVPRVRLVLRIGWPRSVTAVG